MSDHFDKFGVDIRFRLPKESDASDKGLLYWKRSGVWMRGEWKGVPVDATHWVPEGIAKTVLKDKHSRLRMVSCAKCGSSHVDGGLVIHDVHLRDGATGEVLDKVCPNCMIYSLTVAGIHYEMKVNKD